MPKKKNKHYKPQNHTDSKGIVSTYRNGYNQGLCDGQVIMADIIFIALTMSSALETAIPKSGRSYRTEQIIISNRLLKTSTRVSLKWALKK